MISLYTQIYYTPAFRGSCTIHLQPIMIYLYTKLYYTPAFRGSCTIYPKPIMISLYTQLYYTPAFRGSCTIYPQPIMISLYTQLYYTCIQGFLHNISPTNYDISLYPVILHLYSGVPAHCTIYPQPIMISLYTQLYVFHLHSNRFCTKARKKGDLVICRIYVIQSG